MSSKGGDVRENWLFEFQKQNLYCLNFDGVDDHIDFGDILETYLNFTIEFWINPDSVSSGTIVDLRNANSESTHVNNTSFKVTLQSGGEIRLFYESGNSVNQQVTTGTGSDNFALAADTWTHIAVVRNDSDSKAHFYKNGVLIESIDMATDPTGGTSSGHNLSIGDDYENDLPFNGDLSHLRIWNDVRTQAEISDNYLKEVDENASNLVAYWKMNEGSGTEVKDYSSNNNVGTIDGASWAENGNFLIPGEVTLRFAFQDYIDSLGKFYHGVILNRPNIRESINLEDSTAKSGNLSLEIPDFSYEGSPISEELFGGSTVYLNQDMNVYSKFDNEDKVLIETFRLRDMAFNGETLTLDFESHRPWDLITVPNVKTPRNNYFPVTYGDYTAHSSTVASPQFITNNDLHPVKVEKSENQNFFALQARSNTGGKLYYYEKSTDVFVPLDDVQNTSVTYGDGNVNKTNIDLDRSFSFRPLEIITGTLSSGETNSYADFDDNGAEIIDADATTFSQVSYTHSDFVNNVHRSANTTDGTESFGTTYENPTLTGSWVAGTYAGVTQSETSGSGTGLKVTIIVNASDVTDVKVILLPDADIEDCGTGYVVGDTVKFQQPGGTATARVTIARIDVRCIKHFGLTLPSVEHEIGAYTINWRVGFELDGQFAKGASGTETGMDIIFYVSDRTIDLEGSNVVGKFQYNVTLKGSSGTRDIDESDTNLVEISPVSTITGSTQSGYHVNGTTIKNAASGSTLISKDYVSGLTGQSPTEQAAVLSVVIIDHTPTTTVNNLALTWKIYDTFITPRTKIPIGDSDAAKAIGANEAVAKIDQLYSSMDGLRKSWDDLALTEIHEAHRDCLIRFTGLPSSITPEGYSDLNTQKDWRIRKWDLEPRPLQEILEELQFNGGFIHRLSKGKHQYIFIKDSYSSTDATLTQKDIANVRLNPTSISSLISKMKINYRKHAAENRYLTTVDFTNATSRSKYNYNDNEGVKEVNLDAYVGTSASDNDIPTTPSSNPNDDWATYYNNIIGDVTLIVSFKIVNPKYLNLEVGQIIDFTHGDMYPEKPFYFNSGSWNNLKFMITKTNRTVGSTSIVCRKIA